jgi:hypothetical protein
MRHAQARHHPAQPQMRGLVISLEGHDCVHRKTVPFPWRCSRHSPENFYRAKLPFKNQHKTNTFPIPPTEWCQSACPDLFRGKNLRKQRNRKDLTKQCPSRLAPIHRGRTQNQHISNTKPPGGWESLLLLLLLVLSLLLSASPTGVRVTVFWHSFGTVLAQFCFEGARNSGGENQRKMNTK